MLLIAAFAAAVASSGDRSQASLQVFAGPTFEHFAAASDATCPKVRARYVTAGDLAGWEVKFIDALPRAQRARVLEAVPRRRGGGPEVCEARNGLSCPASTNLDAIARAGLMDRFVAFVCARERGRR